MSDLLDRIEKLAGPLRAKTFRAAAEWVLPQKYNSLDTVLETGSYRGIDADGQSTVILGLIASQMQVDAYSFENDSHHIDLARARLKDYDASLVVLFQYGDCLFMLAKHMRPIRFAYLDSFDHDPKNPGPCQRHQLAEVGAIIGRMTAPCAILMDDNIPETGGKTKLAAAFLEDRGWKKRAEGYQLFYVLE